MIIDSILRISIRQQINQRIFTNNSANNIQHYNYNTNMPVSRSSSVGSRRQLTPTKSPLSKIHKSLKHINLFIINSKQNTPLQSQALSIKKFAAYSDKKILKDRYGLTSIQRQQQKWIINSCNKKQRDSSLEFINEKIQYILQNYKEYDHNKHNKSHSKISSSALLDPNILQLKKRIPCNNKPIGQSIKQNKTITRFNPKRNKQNSIQKYKNRITLKDITTQNINYLQSSQIYLQQQSHPTKIIKSHRNKQLLTPQKPFLQSKKVQMQYGTIENYSSINFSFHSSSQKSNKSHFPFSTDLNQLQQTRHNIDQMLQNLQKDFLNSKEQQTQLYVNEQIRVPKIFRKNKKHKHCDQNLINIQNKDLKNKNGSESSKQISTNRNISQFQLINDSDEMLKLMIAFDDQIQLDDQFRKIKCWFKRLKNDEKWKQLERQLKKSKLWINQLTMKALFLIQSEQQNPFQSIQDEVYTIKSLIIAFQTAEQHWYNQISNKFDGHKLIQQGLTQSILDASRKGHISIEDLIRLINFKLKKFYCNRDLNLIYLRLKGSEKMQFDQFLKQISTQIQ